MPSRNRGHFFFVRGSICARKIDWIFVKILAALKSHKLTILVGLTSLAVGFAGGATALSLGAKATSVAKPSPLVSQTPRPHPVASPAETGDPSRMDISASVAETYPDLPASTDSPTLPAGSLDPVADPAFPVATNQLELSFFKRAKASCDEVKAKGAKFYSWDGSYALWAKDASGLLRANIFDSKGAYKGTTAGFGNPPSICYPSGVNEQRLAGNTLFASMYWLESIDGVEYLWHSHEGGPDVSTVHFYFTNELVSSAWEFDSGAAWIRYGLTPLELKSALKDYEK
jgi:hypothetical protein